MLATLFALPLLSLAVLAEPHGHSGFQRHHQVAKRGSSDVHLYEKKFSGARWSFYAAGQYAFLFLNRLVVPSVDHTAAEVLAVESM
jgi:hypothetical protein